MLDNPRLVRVLISGCFCLPTKGTATAAKTKVNETRLVAISYSGRDNRRYGYVAQTRESYHGCTTISVSDCSVQRGLI